MVDGIESVGELVTGGMTARAVEPSAGEGAGHGSTCLNCGAALRGEYCHACGQKGHVHRTLGAFGHDIAHSVLHFDGKIWRTLPMLAWHPGALTRRYIGGERARFVSPMALFLFSVFLMFAVFSSIGGPITFGDTVIDRNEAAQEMKKERAERLEDIAKLKRERERLAALGAPTRAVELSIRSFERQIATLDATSKIIASGTQEEVQEAVTGFALAGAGGAIDVNTGWAPLDEAITKASENPSLLAYKLQSNAYKFSWALIPISVPFLWLMFLHRRRYWQYKAYDHIVFVTYSIAFMSLGIICLSLLRPLGVGEAIIWTAIAFVPPFHMYRQLRGAYRLSRWSAVWRTFLLVNFAFVAASLFFLLLLTLGVLG